MSSSKTPSKKSTKLASQLEKLQAFHPKTEAARKFRLLLDRESEGSRYAHHYINLSEKRDVDYMKLYEDLAPECVEGSA